MEQLEKKLEKEELEVIEVGEEEGKCQRRRENSGRVVCQCQTENVTWGQNKYCISICL